MQVGISKSINTHFFPLIRGIMRIFIVWILLIEIMLSQSVSIHGLIYESSTKEPILGANVYIKELDIGSSADENGYFALTDLEAGKYEITFSHIQFEKKIISIRLEDDKVEFLEIEMNKTEIKSPVIEVYGNKYVQRYTTSDIRINTNDIEFLPVIGEPDLFRSLESNPGVTTGNDWNLGLYVRGGNRDQNLVLLDGMCIFSPYHLSGIFSTFDSDAIQQANMQKIVCDASNGNRLSSVLDINIRDGNSDEHSGYLNISMLSSKMRLEGPLSFGSYMFSIRRTYADLLVNTILSIANSNWRFPYNFIDGMGKIVIKPWQRHRIELSSYIGRDNYDVGAADQSDLPCYTWQNSAIGGKHLYFISPKINLTNQISYSSFIAEYLPDDTTYTEYIDNELNSLQYKSFLSYAGKSFGKIRIGGEYQNIFYRLRSGGFSYQKLAIPRTEFEEISYFFDYNTKIFNRIIFSMGSRYIVAQKNKTYLSPFISFNYSINPLISTNIQFSRTHQNLLTLGTEEVLLSMFDAWVAIPENMPMMEADQGVFGIEYIGELNLVLNLYKKKINKLIEYNTAKFSEIQPDFVCGTANSAGLEMLFQKETEKYTARVSYMYSKTRKQFNNEKYKPKYDMPHYLTVDVSCKYSEKTMVGLKFIYHSGANFTKQIGTYSTGFPDYEEGFISNNDAYSDGIIYSGRNEFRLPAYHRIDISCSRKIKWHNKDFEWYLNLTNIYGRLNVLDYQGGEEEGETESYIQLPPMATIGIRGKLW